MKILTFFLAAMSMLVATPARSLSAQLFDRLLPVASSPILTIVQKNEKIGQIYAEQPAKPSSSTPDEDIAASMDLFHAADLAASHAIVGSDRRSSSYVDDMWRAYQKLARYKHVSIAERTLMYKALISERRWSDAMRTAGESAAHPLTQVQVVDVRRAGARGAGGSTAIFLSANGKYLERRPVAFPAEAHIVVVSGCHAAQKAADWIESDPMIREAFIRGKALWLEPAGPDLDVEELQRWRTRHPEMPAAVAYRNTDWPGVDFSVLPRFYFFRGKTLIGQTSSWGATIEGRSDVLEYLRSLELIAEPDRPDHAVADTAKDGSPHPIQR